MDNASVRAGQTGNGALRPDMTSVDTTLPSFIPESTVPLSSETHSGEGVAIYASGPKAHLVRGVMEQKLGGVSTEVHWLASICFRC